jgi:hypothetical protein
MILSSNTSHSHSFTIKHERHLFTSDCIDLPI